MSDLDQIRELNKSKSYLKEGDLVKSKKYGYGKIVIVLIGEDVWNPIGVLYDNNPNKRNLNWLDAKGGGSDTPEGDAVFYKKAFNN